MFHGLQFFFEKKKMKESTYWITCQSKFIMTLSDFFPMDLLKDVSKDENFSFFLKMLLFYPIVQSIWFTVDSVYRRSRGTLYAEQTLLDENNNSTQTDSISVVSNEATSSEESSETTEEDSQSEESVSTEVEEIFPYETEEQNCSHSNDLSDTGKDRIFSESDLWVENDFDGYTSEADSLVQNDTEKYLSVLESLIENVRERSTSDSDSLLPNIEERSSLGSLAENMERCISDSDSLVENVEERSTLDSLVGNVVERGALDSIFGNVEERGSSGSLVEDEASSESSLEFQSDTLIENTDEKRDDSILKTPHLQNRSHIESFPREIGNGYRNSQGIIF